MDLSVLQFDVAHKLKKLKTAKSDSPNPFAEAAIQAAKASSAMQNFQNPNAAGGSSSSTGDKRKKDGKKVFLAFLHHLILKLDSASFNKNACFFVL